MSRTRSTLAALSLTATAAVLGMPAAHAAAAPAANGQTGVVTSYCSNHPSDCDRPHGGVGAGEGGSLVGMSPAELSAGASLAVLGLGGAVVAMRRRNAAGNVA
jgi:hypothetical protein